MIYIMKRTTADSDIVTSFMLGKSVVVVLPKKLGIKPGVEYSVVEKNDQIVLHPKKKSVATLLRSLKKLSVSRSPQAPSETEIDSWLSHRFDEEYDQNIKDKE